MKPLLLIYSGLVLADSCMDAWFKLVPFWILVLAYLGAVMDLYFLAAILRKIRGVSN